MERQNVKRFSSTATKQNKVFLQGCRCDEVSLHGDESRSWLLIHPVKEMNNSIVSQLKAVMKNHIKDKQAELVC